MSVSELKAKFNSSGGSALQSPGTAFGSGATEHHRQPTAAATTTTASAASHSRVTTPSHLPAVLTGPRPFGSSISGAPKPAAGGGGGGGDNSAADVRGSGNKTAATSRLSTTGAFGVVLKSTASSSRTLELDVNGDGDDADGSASSATAAAANSASPGAAAHSASSSANEPINAHKTAASESDRMDASPSGVASSIGKFSSSGAKGPLPLTSKPTTPAAAGSGVASVKPALAVRPVGLSVPGSSATAATGTSVSLLPGSTVRTGALSPSSAISPSSERLAREKHLSPTAVPSQKSPLKVTVPPPLHTPVPDKDEPTAAPEDSVAGRLEAIKRRLQPVTATADDKGRVSVNPSKTAATAEAAVVSPPPAKPVGAAQAVVTGASGARFRKVQFVAPREAAVPDKPNSLSDCALPSVTWAEAESSSAPVSPTPTSVNIRAVSLIAPTTEEEEYDEGSSGSFTPASSGGSASAQQPAVPPLPPRLAGPAAISSPSVSSSDIAASEVYDEGVSAAATIDDDEQFEEYDDVSALPPLPQRNAALLAKVDSADAAKRRKEEEEKRQKEEERKQKEEEKRLKEEEKRQKAKEKEEKKEREKREKEAQKREAELQKLLASFKVSATDQPVCEASVIADNLKPGKNELSVKTGDRLLILAKDAKGKWLAKSCSSGSIGIVTSSIISELDSRSDGEEQYAEADDVYSELD